MSSFNLVTLCIRKTEDTYITVGMLHVNIVTRGTVTQVILVCWESIFGFLETWLLRVSFYAVWWSIGGRIATIINVQCICMLCTYVSISLKDKKKTQLTQDSETVTIYEYVHLHSDGYAPHPHLLTPIYSLWTSLSGSWPLNHRAGWHAISTAWGKKSVFIFSYP